MKLFNWKYISIIVLLVSGFFYGGYLLGERKSSALREIIASELHQQMGSAATSIHYKDREDLEIKRRNDFQRMFMAASNSIIYKKHGYLSEAEYEQLLPMLKTVNEYANKYEEDYNYFFLEELYDGNRSKALKESDEIFKQNLQNLKDGDF